ncbi:MAG TPA: DUF4097 family beta strand repeat-containing protein [Candidatus Polarisedimenticolia bacterium]|nr:DUF4097 family beta strand repeat-containing protein [Candidatus Polarisedimenticolia bacterium]
MSLRRKPDCPGGEGHGERGFTGFLRSLLSGIPWSERAEREETITVVAPPGGVLRIHNSNGRTKVTGEERTDIEVTSYKTARAESQEAAAELLEEIQVVFTETPEGLDLEVETPRRWNRRGGAHLCVRVPQSIMLAVSAANGRVHIENIRGGVRAKSTNGAVCVDDVVGDVEIATSNAKVACTCTRGRLTARSSNGKIEIDEHHGSIDASTSNGLIRARIDELGKEGIQMATSNGRITLHLPEEVDAELDIRVDNGVIRNDRSLEKTSRDSGGRVLGRLGSGGPMIKLRTSNGSVALH